jgi:flavin reductase (DIM6/NTAB) family NADH-FMN oxidoreductase RutF
MRTWSSGVTIVTARSGGDQHGMTVSSFTSVSLDPPLIIISLHTGSHTYRLVKESGAFAVNILSGDQKLLSESFAGSFPDLDRFEGLQTEVLETGAPIITGSLAGLDCRVTQVLPAGMNTVFLAEVVAVREGAPGQPLVYHDRKYGSFTSQG